MRSLFIFSVLAFALGACSSTYHPEFHPVTVSHVVVTGRQPVVVEQPQQPGVPFEFFEPLDR